MRNHAITSDQAISSILGHAGVWCVSATINQGHDYRMTRPAATSGMHHVALNVSRFEQCEKFYVDLLGMKVEWRPDSDNVYLCSGNDNLALHRLVAANSKTDEVQRLDHIGFILKKPELVDDWYDYLNSRNVKIRTMPKTHRDGARSFYCEDPEGNVVQMIYHPPLEHL